MPVKKLLKCPKDFVEIIYKIAAVLGLKNFKYIGYEDIDSFHSGLFNVLLKGIRDGQQIKHSVMVKWQPDHVVRSAMKELYTREILVYQVIVPNFLEIQRRFKVIQGLRITFPNCIFTRDEKGKETIAIMSLRNKPNRFSIHNRFCKIDFSHSALVMKYLAKFHALSFVLENTNPEEFDKIKQSYLKDVQYSDPELASRSMQCFYDASVNVVSDPVAKAKLKELSPNILSVLYKCTLPVPPYSSICHGDCWNNNTLYRYKVRT